jgi:extracellular factor (EF) 3-hydroxypalmitic acid methyl ester biosynthesis protein
MYASKYSVWVDSVDDDFGSRVEGLELRIEDKYIDMAPGRMLPERGDEPKEGMRRFVSLGRFFDFEKFFFRSKIDEIDSSFSERKLILGYKDEIKEPFRQFVSGLTYDLNVYANHLDQLDAEFSQEPEAVRDIIQASIIAEIAPPLMEYLDAQLGELEALASGFSAEENEHHGYYFRKQLWNVILRSPILARTNQKPRGYSGDSEMMRMIYHNGYMGGTTFGRILHKYSVGKPAAQAVRNRRVVIADILKRRSLERASDAGEKVRVLSVACGPAFEIRDIVQSAEDASRIHFSMLDLDELALLEVASLIDELEKSLGTKISADLIKESVRTLLVSRELKTRWGRFDFIYSMGLFDYLTAPVASVVIKKLYQLLKPDGEMVIGNFASGNPTRYFMEYWHDWKLIYRSEADMVKLASDLSGAEIGVTTDETGIQMLMRITKRGVDE